MYCINGNSSWYSDCGPLFGGCPLLGVSVIGGSTVYYSFYDAFAQQCFLKQHRNPVSVIVSLIVNQNI